MRKLIISKKPAVMNLAELMLLSKIQNEINQHYAIQSFDFDQYSVSNESEASIDHVEAEILPGNSSQSSNSSLEENRNRFKFE